MCFWGSFLQGKQQEPEPDHLFLSPSPLYICMSCLREETDIFHETVFSCFSKTTSFGFSITLVIKCFIVWLVHHCKERSCLIVSSPTPASPPCHPRTRLTETIFFKVSLCLCIHLVYKLYYSAFLCHYANVSALS